MALTRRQRARTVRGVQYVIGLAVLIFIGFAVDWKQFSKSWFNFDVAGQMFPDVITTALVNTLLYTALGFSFGLALAIVLALMRLSSIRLYRWLAASYIELFRASSRRLSPRTAGLRTVTR